MTKDERPIMAKDELEGRIRAIEAVLIELREVTPDVIDAAKAYLRDPKRWSDPKKAEVRLQIAGNLDEHAEKALDDLKWRKNHKDRTPPQWAASNKSAVACFGG